MRNQSDKTRSHCTVVKSVVNLDTRCITPYSATSFLCIRLITLEIFVFFFFNMYEEYSRVNLDIDRNESG